MNVMVIGGTSGIGLALARHYLEQGASVLVAGRDLGRLEAGLTDSQPRLRGCQVDIGDRAALAAALDGAGQLDLLIVTAGMYADSTAIQAEPALALRMLHTNVTGLNQAFELAALKMKGQGGGQLVAVASVAGLLSDYPGASMYSATKRAVMVICDNYRKALAPYGIAVTALVPGYIDTVALRALNRGDASHKPFLLSEAEAVRTMVKAIGERTARRVFPWQMHVLVGMFNLLPARWRRVRRK